MEYPTVSRSQARLDEALSLWVERAQDKECGREALEELLDRMERAAIVVQAAFQQWFMDKCNVAPLEGVAEQRMNRLRRTHPTIAREMDALMFGDDSGSKEQKIAG